MFKRDKNEQFFNKFGKRYAFHNGLDDVRIGRKGLPKVE